MDKYEVCSIKILYNVVRSNFRGQGQPWPQRRLTEHRVTEGYLWRTVEVMVDILDDDGASGVLGEMTRSLLGTSLGGYNMSSLCIMVPK